MTKKTLPQTQPPEPLAAEPPLQPPAPVIPPEAVAGPKMLVPEGQWSPTPMYFPPVQDAPVRYPASVGRSIIAVQRELGRIGKEGYNSFQRYKYVKWEDISARLSPLLAEHNLIIHQSEVERTKLDSAGATLAIVYEFTLIHAETGEFYPPIRWTGMCRLISEKGVIDDKAAAKCHTQAEKYACIKLFKIVIDDAIDSDADGAQKPPPQSSKGVEFKPAFTPAQAAELLAKAREAADKGRIALQTFWANLEEDERAVVLPISAELASKRDAADAKTKDDFIP